MTSADDPDQPPGLSIVPLADRPELGAQLPALLASRWPAYMLEGHPGHQVDLEALVFGLPEYQLLLVSDDGDLCGSAIALPLPWDGTVDDLPEGWDAAITRSAESQTRGEPATALCPLSITIAEHVGRQGLAAELLLAMQHTAHARGLDSVVIAIRPSRKADYPLIPMERYLTWQTPRGEAFDPWVRLHRRAGGEVLGVCPRSMTITGTLREWQEWLQQEIPDSGEYILPGGLAPLVADKEADLGVYVEANVWIRHRPRP